MEIRIEGRRSLAMFPGQGSQRPGMAAELVKQHPQTAGAVFAAADAALGLPITDLCVSGTPEVLRRTDVTQPAILATSLAAFAVLRAHGFEPVAAAGHSLGEYAALTAAGVLTPEAALRLVRRRGELMAETAGRTAGAMIAVIGLPAQQIEELCALSSHGAAGWGVAEVANFNDPEQTVVSGERTAVGEVARLAADIGAQRVVRLDVGAPFHCSLMRQIEDEFGAELDRHQFSPPQLAVISSVTGKAVQDAGEARRLLRRQLTGPVRWVDTVRRAAALGCDALVEVGPGRVLTGFAKHIVPELPSSSTGTRKGLAALLAGLGREAAGSRPAAETVSAVLTERTHR
jgi:[acyl-carrier-protein] S-malonyltransferase